MSSAKIVFSLILVALYKDKLPIHKHPLYPTSQTHKIASIDHLQQKIIYFYSKYFILLNIKRISNNCNFYNLDGLPCNYFYIDVDYIMNK